MMKCLPRVTLSLVTILALWFCVACSSGGRGAEVLFDQAHGQRFLVEKKEPLDLSGFADLFRAEGLTVGTTTDPLTPAVLEGVRVLILSGPFVSYTSEEVGAIVSFLENGGTLCVMLHIPSPAAELLKELGVAISNGVIHEQDNLLGNGKNDLDFRISRLKKHPLTSGLPGFNVYGTWALMNTRDNAEVIAETGPRSWVDLNMDRKLSNGDAMQPLGVVVSGTRGKGRFLVFGDDAIFQNQFLKEDNEGLAINLVRWAMKNR